MAEVRADTAPTEDPSLTIPVPEDPIPLLASEHWPHSYTKHNKKQTNKKRNLKIKTSK